MLYLIWLFYAQTEKARDVRPVVESSVTSTESAGVNSAAAAETESAMNQRREEERRQREDMSRTINLDQHREALYHTDDV